MNKALLPILARLHSLQVVSRLGPDGARLVASRSDPDPITVILREINETVLGRALHFVSESGARLSIEASGRRILCVTDAQGLAGAEACLAAPAVDDALKDDLIKLLQAFAVPRQEIRVTSAPLSHNAEGVSVGLPIALIADLLLVELNGFDAELSSGPPLPVQAEPLAAPAISVPSVATAEVQALESRIKRFIQANGPVLMAWLIVGGSDDGGADGPEEMVDHLRAFLAEEIGDVGTQLDKVSATPGGPVCIALGATLMAGHSILCARLDGGLLLGLSEGDSTQTLLSAWTAALS